MVVREVCPARRHGSLPTKAGTVRSEGCFGTRTVANPRAFIEQIKDLIKGLPEKPMLEEQHPPVASGHWARDLLAPSARRRIPEYPG